MNEAQFKCPKCGNDVDFTADSVVLFNARVHIDRDGWDYFSSGGDVDLAPNASMECGSCGYFASASEFAI